MTDPTTRFSTRVENYLRYRPGYPAEMVPALRRHCGLQGDSVVADIGSGTGLLTRLFLENGNRVFAVEPNAEMREAGERLLGGYPGFQSVAAAAEATTLPDQSIDLIAAGQAFHWFDRVRCRSEFRRILRPPGWVALIWNDRKTESNPFLAAYESLLREYATDYSKVDHKQIDAAVLRDFFGADPLRLAFKNAQQFDFDSLRGRLLSSSYAPESGHPRHEPMIRALKAIFDTYQRHAQVRLEYDTVAYLGRIEG